MFCRKCGVEVRAGAKFCHKCGHPAPVSGGTASAGARMPGGTASAEARMPGSPYVSEKEKPGLIKTMPEQTDRNSEEQFQEWFSDAGDL